MPAAARCVETRRVAPARLWGRHAELRRRVREALLQAQRATALRLLAENRHLVEALRDALLDREELVGSEITDVLEGAAAARTIDLTDGAVRSVR